MEHKRPGGSMKQPLGDAPTRSQLLPLQANWRAVMSKGYFWPGVITAIATVLLMNYVDSKAAYTVTCNCFLSLGKDADGHVFGQWGRFPVDVPIYIIVLALYITAALAFGAYRIIGKAIPIWVLPAIAAVTFVILDTPLFDLAHVLDFGVKDLADSFSPLAVVQGFFAAGLPEEALKAMPIFVGLWIGKKIQDRTHFLWPLRVAEPLDGILIGVASGLGFTLNETLGQYIPQAIMDGWIPKLELATAATPGQLLIPRVLGNIAGHAAYSGIFGYYIGMAALRPSSWKKFILIGLGIAGLLHGVWDSRGGTFVHMIDALATFGLLAAVIMKARELSPNRSQLIRSQVIDGVAGRSATASRTVSAQRPSPSMTAANGIARSETWGQRSETWGEVPRGEQLDVGGNTIALTVGTRITETQIPSLKSSAGDSIVAMLAANPDDPKMLGLKNLSTESWRVETVGRGTRELSPGRSIRIERGVRLHLGSAEAVIK